MPNEDIAKMNGGKKFDICLMNPPYLGKTKNEHNFHLKFLNKAIEISSKVVSIQPIGFLYKTYDRKSPDKDEKKVIEYFEKFSTSIEEIDGNKVFDADFGIKLGIIDVCTNSKDDIIRIDGKKYSSVSQVNLFSHDSLLVEFNNVVSQLYKKDNLRKHWVDIDKRNPKQMKKKEEDGKSRKWFVNVAKIRGNKGCDDVYTLIPKDRKAEIGERNFNFYINFDSEVEANNFINYAKTDFASACLYLFKQDLSLGPYLNYVPWFNFLDPHFSNLLER